MIEKFSDSLWIVGTSHVARQSHKEVREAFEGLDPDIVALELDKQRLQTLLSGVDSKPSLKMVRHVGVFGFLFLVIASFVQRKIGDVVGVKPGSEMRVAHALAFEHKKRVLLADRPIHLTLRRLSSAKGWKSRLVWDLLSAPFRKKKLGFDPRKVPSEKVLLEVMGVFAERYPKLYGVLVSERDEHIAKATRAYQEQHPEHKILLVVGAGHIPGIKKHLSQKAL